MDQTEQWTFSFRDPDIVQMTLGKGHDTPLGHKESLCEVEDSNVPP